MTDGGGPVVLMGGGPPCQRMRLADHPPTRDEVDCRVATGPGGQGYPLRGTRTCVGSAPSRHVTV